jgi:hypothetical protein
MRHHDSLYHCCEGNPAPRYHPIYVEECEVDIVDKMEQLEEQFLLEVNRKGHVRPQAIQSSSSRTFI